MKCCAVVDKNVLVAALLSKRDDSATVRVIRAMISGEFIPLYHEDILAEYEDVLHRKKKNKHAATKAGRSIGLTDRCFFLARNLKGRRRKENGKPDQGPDR